MYSIISETVLIPMDKSSSRPIQNIFDAFRQKHQSSKPGEQKDRYNIRSFSIQNLSSYVDDLVEAEDSLAEHDIIDVTPGSHNDSH